MKTTFLALATLVLLAVACSSDSDDVATLGDPTATTVADVGVSASKGERSAEIVEISATAEATEPSKDDEAKVMAFAECMRAQGFEYKDPDVDSKGNVQRPQLVEGVSYNRAELGAPYRQCSEHLEGITFGQERPDLTEAVDNAVELAICLRGKGLDIDDPTIETFAKWRSEFRAKVNLRDPKNREAYDACTHREDSENSGGR